MTRGFPPGKWEGGNSQTSYLSRRVWGANYHPKKYIHKWEVDEKQELLLKLEPELTNQIKRVKMRHKRRQKSKA
jgi:hypothetical protein